MNLQQLRSVREAVRRGFNLTEVANVLFTSQPGVSRQIRELEEELGIDVFVRHGKRLTGLTPPGKALIPLVEQTLLCIDNLRRVGEDFSDQTSGKLSVAATHSQARYALPAPAPVRVERRAGEDIAKSWFCTVLTAARLWAASSTPAIQPPPRRLFPC